MALLLEGPGESGVIWAESITAVKSLRFGSNSHALVTPINSDLDVISAKLIWPRIFPPGVCAWKYNSSAHSSPIMSDRNLERPGSDSPDCAVRSESSYTPVMVMPVPSFTVLISICASSHTALNGGPVSTSQ